MAFIVLAISAGSVVFGVEWMSAPMTPMPASPYQLRAAAPPAVQQAVTKPVDVVTPASPPAETAGKAVSSAPVAAAPTPPVQPTPVVAAVAPEPTPLVVPEPVAPATAAAPLCDIQACERAYRSFTASDCTYQPSDGPRRLCTRGTPPAAASAPRSDIRAQATCNIAACTSAYISFTASDCTYQPSEGPRRLCEK
ncbi:BA14K family protein [Pseudolabrys sp. FHR47]|uniref:BA14K family protein n=1 Tax=Pseudolabrys sp. FHR47 TaxID=2562284 RepID=UPI001FF037BA|nr:BA14K family protein [Pseudolabrys sp. FHR47]